MSEAEGWFVITESSGPLTDRQLIKHVKQGDVSANTQIYHPVKTKGKVIQAGRLKAIAKTIEGQSANLPATTSRLEFKGYVIGETTFDWYLNEFERHIKGATAPQRSSAMHPDAAASIHAEKWYADVGIECCRASFPFEWQARGILIHGRRQTVAGIEVEDWIHTFVDGVLQQMILIVPSHGFRTIQDAISAKYGAPVENEVNSYQNAYGASFDGEETSWLHNGVVIFGEQFFGDRDTSKFEFAIENFYSMVLARKPTASIEDM